MRFATDGTPDITLITCTGDRPEPFALCERWMDRQTYAGSVQWLVVDDGYKPTEPTRGQTYIRREARDDDPQHTLPLNLLAAIPHVKGELVLFIEDDDYYKPDFVARLVSLLSGYDIAGHLFSLHYRVNTCQWSRRPNDAHVSMYQTGLRAGALPVLAEICKREVMYVDMELWRAPGLRKRLFSPPPDIAIGVKGLPGRQGITGGWLADSGYENDLGLRVFHQWFGVDARHYERYLGTPK